MLTMLNHPFNFLRVMLVKNKLKHDQVFLVWSWFVDNEEKSTIFLLPF